MRIIRHKKTPKLWRVDGVFLQIIQEKLYRGPSQNQRSSLANMRAGVDIAAIFRASLPDFLHTMPIKNRGLVWLPRTKAMSFERFRGYQNDRQFMMADHDNLPLHTQYAAHKLFEREPNFICYNIDNPNRCQPFWYVRDAVHCHPAAKTAQPYRYLRAIERAYDEHYGLDKRFGRYIHRNPFHWRVDTDWRHNRSYSLAELAEPVNLNKYRGKDDDKELGEGEGRNTALFDELRFWAYSCVKQAKSGSYEAWHQQVVTRAHALNTFREPLSPGEVASTARSVAEFTYFRYEPQGVELTPAYRALQARNGRIGGKRSQGGGRPKAIDAETAQRIELMSSMGYSQAEQAERLGLSLSTIERHMRATRKVK